MPDKLKRDRVEACILLRVVGRHECPNDKISRQIQCAADRLGWTYWRTFDVWYSKPKIVIRAHELDELRAWRVLDTY